MRFSSLSAICVFLFSLSGGQIVLIDKSFSQNVSQEAIRKYMQKHNKSGKGRNFKRRKRRLYDKALRRYNIKPNRRKKTARTPRQTKPRKSGMASWCRKTFKTCITANATCQPFLCGAKRGADRNKKQPQLPKFYKKRGSTPLLNRHVNQPDKQILTAPKKKVERRIYMPGQAHFFDEPSEKEDIASKVVKVGTNKLNNAMKLPKILNKIREIGPNFLEAIAGKHVYDNENLEKILFDKKSKMRRSEKERCYFGKVDAANTGNIKAYCKEKWHRLPEGCHFCDKYR